MGVNISYFRPIFLFFSYFSLSFLSLSLKSRKDYYHRYFVLLASSLYFFFICIFYYFLSLYTITFLMSFIFCPSLHVSFFTFSLHLSLQMFSSAFPSLFIPLFLYLLLSRSMSLPFYLYHSKILVVCSSFTIL